MLTADRDEPRFPLGFCSKQRICPYKTAEIFKIRPRSSPDATPVDEFALFAVFAVNLPEQSTEIRKFQFAPGAGQGSILENQQIACACGSRLGHVSETEGSRAAEIRTSELKMPIKSNDIA